MVSETPPHQFPQNINDFELGYQNTNLIYVAFNSPWVNSTALYVYQLGATQLNNYYGWTDITPTGYYEAGAIQIDNVPQNPSGPIYDDLITGVAADFNGSHKLDLRWLQIDIPNPNITSPPITVNTLHNQNWIVNPYPSTSYTDPLYGLWFRVYEGLECSETEQGKVYIPGHDLHVVEFDPLINNWVSQKNDIYVMKNTHVDVRGIGVIPNNSGLGDFVFSANDGGIAKTDTEGKNKNNPPAFNYIHGQSGINITQIYSFGVNPFDINKVVFGAQDNGTQSKNGYYLFNKNRGGDGTAQTLFNPFDQNTVFFGVNGGSGSGGVYHHNYDTADSFWSGPAVGHSARITAPIAISQNSSNQTTIYTATHEIFKSVNYGAPSPVNMSSIHNPSNQMVSGLATTLADKDLLVASFYENNQGTIIKSVDAGQTWSVISNSALNNARPKDIVISPTDKNKIWIGCANTKHNTNNGIAIATSKVFYSDDGGTTWSDVSEGLPNVPVNCMTFQTGSSSANRLYIGTDLGVYTREAPYDYTTTWECFNKNLPAVPISDLKVHLCEGKLYASTFGRGLFKTNLYTNYNFAGNTINVNTQWVIDKDIYNDIIIQPGATLSISACNVRIRKGVKIKVEPGGKLILDNAKLTSMCNTPWAGIDVWGDALQAQIPNTNMGVIEISNESVIEHSINGVRLIEGGIIDASSNSTFRNNSTSISFLSYQGFVPSNPSYELFNTSIIQDCNFEVDDEYFTVFNLPQQTTVFPTFISLFEADVDKIYSNHFLNSISFRDYFGYGIVSSNSNLKVLGRCTTPALPCQSGYDQNTFSKLIQGINVSGTGGYKTASLDRNIFNYCAVGIVINAVDNVEITHNELNFEDNYYYGEIGIQLNNSTGYIVENNTISGACTEGSAQNQPCDGVYGIHIINSGPFSNEVYRNFISGLEYGVVVTGINADVSGGSPYELFGVGYDGLQVRCNYFTNNSNDILLDDGNMAQYQGNAFGNIDELAGNIFSEYDMNCNLSKHHFDMTNVSPLATFHIPAGGGGTAVYDIWYTYIHHEENPKHPFYGDFPSKPWCYSVSTIDMYKPGIVNTGFYNTCPNHYEEGFSPESISNSDIVSMQKIDASVSKINKLGQFKTKSSIVDNVLKNDPLLSQSQSWEQLLEKDVLISTPQLYQIIASTNQKQGLAILLSNQEPINLTLKDIIQVKLDTTYFKFNYSTISMFEKKLSELSFEKLKLNRQLNTAINNIVTDSLLTNSTRQLLTQYYHALGTTKAKRKANLLNQKQAIAFDSFEAFEKELYDTYPIVDSSDNLVLLEKYYSDVYGSGLAGALYTQHTGVPLYKTVYVQKNTNGHNQAHNEIQLVMESTSDVTTDYAIFPNPTSNSITVLGNSIITDIDITNVSGKNVYSRRYSAEDKEVNINLAKLKAGVYIININDTETQRLIKR